MLEVIVGSSVIAALITGVVTGLFKLQEQKREDSIRKSEREEARKDRAAELALEDKRVALDRDYARMIERKGEGRAQAKTLLVHLEALQAEYSKQGQLGSFQTYSYRAELVRPVRSVTRLIPDAEFREYIDLAMQVITELWVPASVGEGPEEPSAEQSRILGQLLTQVGRFATDDGWDRALVVELRSYKDSIDEYWEEYHSDARR
ncbi:hypothetical protein [Agromyces laixinhei]|uniref:hypothetical protein n=1 Tax=Agromyces laixinhei TaxID=2585717 RepID=UPI0012ED98B5|nr:hypothetical protein [Agromyces laixinhei]